MKSIHTKAIIIQGVSGKVRNDDMAGIGALWEKLQKKQLHKAIREKLNDDIFCVYHDYLGTHADPFQMTLVCRSQ